MNEPLEPIPGPVASELIRLRREVDELQRIARLVLVGVIIATASLCLFMYRQTKLMQFQILAQNTAVLQAQQQIEPAMAALTIFRRVGSRYPDFASNVLAAPPGRKRPHSMQYRAWGGFTRAH